MLLGAKSFYSDVKFVRELTYSIIFPAFCIICGIFTRLLCSKIWVLIYSFCLNGTILILSLKEMGWIHDADYGIHNIEQSYINYVWLLMLAPYVLISIIKWIKRFVGQRKIIKKVENKNKQSQKSVNRPMFMRVYNKKRDRKERYLVWISKKDRVATSDAIVYYDPVELIAIDENGIVYAFIEEPYYISTKEFVEMQE
jgi:hypothetical protein